MRLIKLCLALVAVLAVGATGAQAAPVTVGSSLTGAWGPGEASGGSGTFVNLAFGEPGTRVASPVSGAVISWSVIDANGPFTLRVLRPAGGTSYTAISSSGVGVASGGPGSGVQTFSTALPIQAGDTIGLDIANGNKIGIQTGDPADVVAVWAPPLANGATAPFLASENELEVGFNAVVQPAPTLVAISPASGSIKGGTVVTIAGTDFANVSGVSFGGVPATSVAVASEGQLTAVAPATKKVGAVDVPGPTVAGTTAAAQFSYKGCKVPNLIGKKLKAARKRIRKAGCKVGNVKLRKGVTRKTGRVVKQGPKAGKVFAPGKKVNVTLG